MEPWHTYEIINFVYVGNVKDSAVARPILREDGTLVSQLGQSKTLEGTLGPPVVSWGVWFGTKQVDAMAKPLACG